MSNLRRLIFDGAGRLSGCLLCGTSAASGGLCAGCRADLPRLPAESCPRCALPSPGGQVCGACLRRPPNFDATVAALAYRFPADALVHNLKYAHRLHVARILGDLLAHRLFSHPAPDALLPMPLHPARLKERGFNQSLEIARVVVSRLGWRLDPGLASRVRDTPPQVGLAAKDRRRNLRGAFACEPDVKDKRIAVLDDVVTSGSSMDELARMLKRAGAIEVIALAVARTLPAREGL